METFKRTPIQLFNQPQRFQIPLFQRPYVWKQEEQWEPLWKDICRVAEMRIAQPHQKSQHFLGAVVLQNQEVATGTLNAWNVVDGQQRLTTLQLLMDATSAVLSASGLDRFASQLESLTHNSSNFVEEGESRLKLRHMNRDRASFDEVMDAETPIDYPNLDAAGTLIAQAHQFFGNAVTQWIGDISEPGGRDRAEALAIVLQTELQLVTIELTAAENSQEIFETLNARGTPLTAGDLIRNFVFQRLESQNEDSGRAYKEDWPFERPFWSKEISVGRFFVSRSSLFFNQWLSARLGEEISPQATFSRFKAFVEHYSEIPTAQLLVVIKQEADQYEKWANAARASSGNLAPVEMAVYRMNASGSQLLYPLFIWLHQPSRKLPEADIDRVIGAAESWIMRRQLLRLTNTDLGRVVADPIHSASSAKTDEVADRIIAHLSRLDVTSTYWPGDDEVRAHLRTENAYKRYPRARLRMVLEAVENSYRAETGQPQIERAGYPIEHILPQKWVESWPVETPEQETDRQDRVHRLGNLTLLTKKLNSKMSNGPWLTKRDALLKHNTVKITGRLLEMTREQGWGESLIDERTTAVTDSILKIWPVPEGHQGIVADPQSKDQSWIELKHLVNAGSIEPGCVITTTHRDFMGTEATVASDGYIELDGQRFSSPSGAAKHLRKSATNGWQFWSMLDGRRLKDVRSEFQSLQSG